MKIFTNIYDKVIELAYKKNVTKYLYFLSFIESSSLRIFMHFLKVCNPFLDGFGLKISRTEIIYEAKGAGAAGPASESQYDNSHCQ